MPVSNFATNPNIGPALRRWHMQQANPNISALGLKGPFAQKDLEAIAALDPSLLQNPTGSATNFSTAQRYLNNTGSAAKATGKTGFWSKFKKGAGSAAGVGADVVGDAAMDAATSGKGGGLKGFFANTKQNLGSAWDNVKSGKGVVPKYATAANVISGAMAAAKAAQAFGDYSDAKSDTDSLISDILASAGGNPNLRYDLSADQLSTLRKLQNGSYDTTGDFDVNSLLGSLGSILTGAGLGFVTGGGPVGAIIGGLSGAVDGVSSGIINNQNQITADLEGLYNALYESEMRNKAMRRDAAMTRYANSLY